ncbi:hypothetical protein M501DRAFT_1014345 [Patellaria atrata CBS 101060]|uniref:TM7S3/TM198-like domain-containing protein n=1 Tax=Patellaria atrata CBS 101060 TaxID=1346257 RepID=A0A9P4SFG4_9PEZI|nr:hypothetical protein M501DRAFT_1014345 [Patellaria atrata CBS 101060]
MRSFRYLLYTVVCFNFSTITTTASHHALLRRQDVESSAASGFETTSRISPTTSQNEESPSQTTSNSNIENASTTFRTSIRSTIASSRSEERPSSTTELNSEESVSPSITLDPTPSPTATNGTSVNREPLPITPKITPALGIIGAIFIISGAIYTVIGIKNKWMYIFLSSAYLAALAVTVLIIYVMNPPVSNAVQGAFFVAACLTGLLFGGVSLIFAEVAEGLGCLLGGFCLSMWFLVLKDGGLIQSAAGKAIFVAAMSLSAFCLAFSRYTRTYGLMVSISFSGATITVLGVDCFSRAGLKEFWLYVWALNEDIFPLFTDTYPMTRGIRAEIAAIIIIFLLGLISQFRLWKIIKERREKREAEKIEAQENIQQEEIEVGRRVENSAIRERERWEAIYGDGRPQPDSGIGSTEGSSGKNSLSVKDAAIITTEEVEMDDFSKLNLRSQRNSNPHKTSIQWPGPTGTVRNPKDSERQSATPVVLSGDVISPVGVEKGVSTKSSEFPFITNNSQLLAPSQRSSQHSSVPGPPEIVPLPFVTSTLEDTGSISNMADDHQNRRLSHRLSATSALKRLSVGRGSTDFSGSREALIIPHDDDRASSVVATLDERDEDNMSLPTLSSPPSPSMSEFSNGALSSNQRIRRVPSLTIDPGDANGRPSSPKWERSESIADKRDSSSKSARQSLISNADPSRGDKSRRTSLNSRRRRSEEIVPASLVAKHLPENLSKVVLSYRTNEWAKHLDGAQTPEDDALSEAPSSPGVRVETQFAEAASPRVPDEGEKQGDAEHGHRLAARNSTSSVKMIQRQSRPSSSSGRPASSQFNARPGLMQSGMPERLVSAVDVTQQGFAIRPSNGLSRPSSSSNVNTVGLRSVSSPMMGQPLVESPTEEASYNPSSARMPGSQAPGSTLLKQRDGLIRNKMSSMSFQGNGSTPNVAIIAPSDTGSIREVVHEDQHEETTAHPDRSHTVSPDNMTLAERKKYIQRQRSLQQGRQSKSPTQMQGSWPIPEQHQIYDSHQPKRVSSIDQGKREAMLASWRETVKQDTQQPINKVASTPAEIEARRAAMMNERRQVRLQEQVQAQVATQRNSAVESMMRRGDMLDLHRNAMRKMQADANKHA